MNHQALVRPLLLMSGFALTARLVVISKMVL